MELTLNNLEIERGRFPLVCARTGEDCEARTLLKLRRPGWRVYFSTIVPIPFLYVYLSLRGSARCTVLLPLEKDEVTSWRLRQGLVSLLVYLGHLNTILASVIVPFYMPPSYMKYYWLMMVMCMLLTIAMTETARRTHLWIKKINKDSVTLAGLHPRFVEEYLYERDERENPRAQRPRAVAGGETTDTDAILGKE